MWYLGDGWERWHSTFWDGNETNRTLLVVANETPDEGYLDQPGRRRRQQQQRYDYYYFGLGHCTIYGERLRQFMISNALPARARTVVTTYG